MTTTPDLGLPELAAQQALPHVTHNEALVLLQALQKGVISVGDNTPPGAPTEGDSYIVGTAPTGAWATYPNRVAIYWGGAWLFVPGSDDGGTPIAMGARQAGLTVYVRDEDTFYSWAGDGASPETYSWSASLARQGASATFSNVTIDTLSGGTANLTALNGAGAARRVNVNGDFQIWQRGASAQPPDNWAVKYSAGGTHSYSREAFTPGAPLGAGNGEPEYFLRWGIAGTTTGRAVMKSGVEDVRTLAGQTALLSFWARADQPRTITSQLKQDFGSGGSSGVFSSYADHAFTTSWAQYFLRLTVPSIAGKTLGDGHHLEILLYADDGGTDQQIDIARVQLTPWASTATPTWVAFDERSYGEELALARRYFERRDNVGSDAAIAAGFCDGTTTANLSIYFSEKRVAPTITFSDPADFGVAINGTDQTCSAIAASLERTSDARVIATVTSGLTGGDGCLLRSLNSSGYIDFDAEIL